jgi:hypothetical protein
LTPLVREARVPPTEVFDGERGFAQWDSMTWSRRPGRWLVITAIFELVLAGVFFVLGFLNPIIRFGLYLIAAFLGVLSVLLLLWGRKWTRGYAEAQRIKTTGASARPLSSGCARPACP